MEISKLVPYAYGRSAINKPLGSKMLEVALMERMPFMDGEATDAGVVETAQGTDSNGRAYTSEAAASETVRAVWFAPGSRGNAVTPPDIRRGEQVIVYRFANSNKKQNFFWTTLGNDISLRKLETILYAINANPVENVFPKDGDDIDLEYYYNNFYTLMASSHQGRITFHTTQLNGEACTWDFDLDLKRGLFTIKDSVDDTIQMSYPDKSILMRNSSGSFVHLIDRVLNLHGVDVINGSSGQSISLKSKDILLDADTITERGGSSIVRDAPTLSDAGFWSLSKGRGEGDTTGYIQGDFLFKGNITGEGNIDIQNGRISADIVEAISQLIAP